MNDGVPSLDETAAEAVRLSVGPRPGAGPEKPRKDRRRIIIGAAAVAVAVLVAGGVCAHRAYESHQASVARDACESAVADQAKAVKAYKTLLGSDATVAALKTDAKSVKDAKTVDTLKRAAAVRLPAMVKCDASKAADLDAPPRRRTRRPGPSSRIRRRWRRRPRRSNRRSWTRRSRTRTRCTRPRTARSPTTRPARTWTRPSRPATRRPSPRP